MAGGGVSRAICWEREAEPEAQQGEVCWRLEMVAAEGTAVVFYSESTKCSLVCQNTTVTGALFIL